MSTATAMAPCPISDTEELIKIEIRNHRTYYLKVAMGILRQIDDAEEAVQSGFMGAWQYRSKFVHSAALRTWMTKITINSCLDMLRKRKTRTIGYQERIEGFMHDVIPSGAPDPEMLCFIAIRREVLWSILNTLSDTERVAFEMAIGRDDFDRKKPQFKSSRHRAVRKLRDGMRDKGYEVNEEYSKERVDSN